MSLVSLEIEAAFTFPTHRLEVKGTAVAGRLTRIRGRSGLGKTTLLRWIAGLETVDAKGSVNVSGQDLSQLKPGDREVAYLFQEPRLLPYLGVIENIVLPAKARGMSVTDRTVRAEFLIQALDLAPVRQTALAKLSGGEQMRVALARALIWKPRLLLLDEPLTALQPELRHRAEQLILDTVRAWNIPALAVTHLDEVFADEPIWQEGRELYERVL